MPICRFHFHGELELFLVPGRRGGEFACSCARSATAKHMIEALGVPHTEVARLLVNGEACGMGRVLSDGDSLEVFPWQAGVGASFADSPRFVADAHLGALARLLRMAGFNTLYRNDLSDEAIARMAEEGRIVLTRDRELLKRRPVRLGCYVLELLPFEQARRVFRRYGLAPLVRPFSLCLECNAPLRQLPREEAVARVPPAAFALNERFTTCPACARVFWPGSHWRRMNRVLEELVAAAAPEPQGVAAEFVLPSR